MKCVGGHVVANGVCCACCQGRIIHKMNWLAGICFLPPTSDHQISSEAEIQ